MQDLNIHLFINPSCELIASDKTAYHNLRFGDDEFVDDISQHISIEFLKDVDGEVMHSTIVFKDCGHNRGYLSDGNNSVFHFPKDGTFYYYKFLIPTLDHLDKGDGHIASKNQLFYYDNKFYYCEESFEGDPNITDEYVISKSRRIELGDLWKFQGTQTFSFEKILFSICKLQRCLVSLQKQILESHNACNNCNFDSSLRSKRDFLLSALYVFDYLKDRHNFEEAQRILDQMSDCSGSLCEDNQDKSDCGCGGVKF